MIAMGVIWGLWHAPVILMGYNYGTAYPGAPWAGVLMMCWMTFVTGTWFGWLALKGDLWEVKPLRQKLASYDEARRAFEREYLSQLMRLAKGNVSQAARLAKRNRTDFYDLLARHRLEPSAFKAD